RPPPLRDVPPGPGVHARVPRGGPDRPARFGPSGLDRRPISPPGISRVGLVREPFERRADRPRGPRGSRRPTAEGFPIRPLPPALAERRGEARDTGRPGPGRTGGLALALPKGRPQDRDGKPH